MIASKSPEAGYTATEALAALAIVGLAVGGLQAGMQAIGRSQDGVTRTTARSVELRQLDRALSDFVSPYGPFRLTQPDAFAGSNHHFSFLCGAVRCDAELAGDALTLSGPGGVRRAKLAGAKAPAFVYASDRGAGQAWPWVNETGQVEKLRSVSIVDAAQGGAAPLAVARLWTQQEPDCEFDTITRDCRRQLGS